jgi:hypothetical protein
MKYVPSPICAKRAPDLPVLSYFQKRPQLLIRR